MKMKVAMQDFQPPSPRDSIDDQAAQWSDLLRHRGGQSGLREAFEQWRAQSTAHAEAFSRIDAVHRVARMARDSAGMSALEQDTLRRVAMRQRHGHLRRTRLRRSWALAASVTLALLGGLLLVQDDWRDLRHLPQDARYLLAGQQMHRTAVGEQRRIALDDGSVITLNTGSRVVVHYQPQQRAVTLLAGQALFEVARDAARPFVVNADGRTVTALGTAFDVLLSQKKFEVTLIEGSVAVQPEVTAESGTTQAQERLVLVPGESLVVAAADPARPLIRKADVKRAVSWREGQLIFRNDRLIDAVEEVNRYSKRQIVLADDTMGSLRVSGIVNTGNTEVFVETMTSYYPLRIVEASGSRVVLGPRG